MINVVCENHRCKNYFEGYCLRSVNDALIHLNKYGICRDYELGRNDMYNNDGGE